MHWLIDGHNLIGQMPHLRLDDPDDEEKLTGELVRYRARTGHKITVIFDSGAGYRPGATRKWGGVTIKFAPPGKSADKLIIRRVRRIKNPQGMMVVTSDRAVQQAARRAGVRVISAGAFAQELSGGSSSNTSAPTDPGSQTDINLSPDEIDEWLDFFNQ